MMFGGWTAFGEFRDMRFFGIFEMSGWVSMRL